MITNFIYAYIFMQFSMYDSVLNTEDRITSNNKYLLIQYLDYLLKQKNLKINSLYNGIDLGMASFFEKYISLAISLERR